MVYFLACMCSQSQVHLHLFGADEILGARHTEIQLLHSLGLHVKDEQTRLDEGLVT